MLLGIEQQKRGDQGQGGEREEVSKIARDLEVRKMMKGGDEWRGVREKQ